MFGTIKAEFRKLFTVRSTYFLLLIALALEILVCWWAKGYDAAHTSAASLHNPATLSDIALTAVSVVSVIYSLAALLLITHEYRYNLITYTLTASKSRSRVLFAKLFTYTVFALACGVLFGVLAPLLARLGMSMHHLTLAPQKIAYASITWRILLASWGMVMYASIIAFLVRNQVGSFVLMFLIPSTIENLLTLWLHNNSVYLPYTALNALLGSTPNNLSFAHTALVVLAWIVGGVIAAWALLQKRDAS